MNKPKQIQIEKTTLFLYLDRKEPRKIDLCNSFGHRLVLYASSFRFDLVQLVGRPHQMKHLVIFQQSVSCTEEENNTFETFLLITLLRIYSCTSLHKIFRWWEKTRGCLSTEFECRENMQVQALNNYLLWNAHTKAGDKSAFYSSRKSQSVLHKTTCISILNESGDVDKSPGEGKQRQELHSQVHIWSVLFWVCVFPCSVCVWRHTYALRGSPGSGHSSAECGALWTELMWRYLSPEMHITVFCWTIHATIKTSHPLNPIESVTEVSSLFQCPRTNS